MARILAPSTPVISSPESPAILMSRITPAAPEILEPRIVYAVNVGAGIASATGLTTAQVNELIEGLENIGSLAHSLEALGTLGVELSGLGQSLGELFNFGTANGKGGFFGAAVRDQLEGLLKDPGLPPSGPTVAQINTWLNTSPLAGTTGDYSGVTWSLVQGGEYAGAHPFEWEMTVSGTKSSLVDFEPDLSAQGIEFSTAPQVAVDATSTLTFSFGLTSAGDFFATFGSWSFGALATAPLAGMSGAVRYTVEGTNYTYTLAAGSTVAAEAGVDGINITGVGSEDGKWTSAELTALASGMAETDFSVGTVTDGGLSGVIRFTTTSGTPMQLLLDDAELLDAEGPETDHDVALTDYVAGGNVTGIFQRIQDLAALLDANPLRNINIPGIGTALSAIEDLPAYAELLSLRDAASAYMAGASITVKGLASALTSALNAKLANAGITLEELKVKTEWDAATSAMLMTFTVDTGDITKQFDFDRFGSAATQVGLSFGRDGNFQIQATLRAKGEFSFGFDLTKSAASAESVFFTQAGLEGTVAFAVTGLDLNATLGPVAVKIEDGTIDATATLALTITDATDDGRYTLAELNNAGEVALGFSSSGTFETELPLDIRLAGVTFVNPMIRIATPNIFTQAPRVDTGTASFDKIFNMGKVGPDAILDLIIAVGDWASNFRNAAIFDVNIPFVNVDLGGAFDFGLLFTKTLRDKLQNDLSFVALKGAFSSFTLAVNTPLVLGEGENSQRIVLPAGTYVTREELVTAFNTALGASSAYEAAVHGDSGVRIQAKNSNDIPAFSLLGATEHLKTIGFLDSSTVVTSEVTLPLAVPTNGKISGNAQFLLSIDGGAPVTITVTKTSTDENADVAALAADLDAALSSYNIDASVVSGKIKLTHTSGKSFMVTGVSGTSFQQLGIESASAAGLTDLGSTLRSGLNYETLTDMVPFLLAELGIDDGDADPSNDPIRARYDAATETFYLHFEHSYAITPIELPAGFNFELEGWAGLRTVNPNAKFTFTPVISGAFDFGIRLADDSSFSELMISAQAGFAPNGYGEKPDGSPDSNNALAWDGKLKGNAEFRISFDDGVEHTLTIAQSSTTTNTSAADLLDDVKAAIAANTALNGKIDARVVAKQGGTSDRIEFFTIEQSGDFQILSFRVRATGADKMGFAPDQLEISDAPVLAVANNAQASLDFSPDHVDGVKFTISLDGGAPVQVAVTQAAMNENTNMAALLADINAAIAATSLAGEVKAVRYGLGTQFQLVAAEGTRQMSFRADSIAAQTTLNFGSDEISTRSRGGTFFVENASIKATGTLALADVDLEAQIGFIGITTEGLAGSVTLSAAITLEDSTGNTRFELGELYNKLGNGSIGDIVQLDLSGTANATLSGLNISAGDFSVTTTANVELESLDIFAIGGADFTINYNGLDATKLLNISNASWREIYEGIKLGVQVLTQVDQFSFLGNTKIPLINLSVTEIFNYTDRLLAELDKIQADPGGTLETVELKIEELLGIPAQNFDLSLEGDSTIRIHLGISTSYSATYGLDFDLKELAKFTNTVIPEDLLTLGGFLDASAQGSLQFGAYASISLDLGLDFSNGAGAPNMIVYKTSGVDLGLRLSGQNLNLTATLGPAGFEISNGSVIFDSDGIYDANGDDLQDADFATIHFGPLADITDIQAALDAISAGASLGDYFGPTFNGVIKAVLPGAITSDIGSLDLPGPILVNVPEVAKLFSSNATTRKEALQLTLPDMSDLLPEVPGLIQLLRNPAILLDGVDSGLSLIQKLLAGKAATNLPLIGNQLRQGSAFIEEFRAGFLADLTTKLRGAGDRLLDTLQTGMFDLFAADTDGANGLAFGILKDYNGDGSVTKDDVVLTFRKANGTIWREGTDDPRDQDAVMFNLRLGQSIEFSTDLDIEWGLAGLELDINGSPTVTAGWDLFFGFGVSITDYFFLDSAPPKSFTGSGVTLTAGAEAEHELALSFEVVLTPDGATPFTATGRLFFLQLDVVDQEVNGEYSHISGKLFVDLTDPGTGSNADQRVTIKELFSRGTVKPITAGLEAEAVVNLALAASVEGSTAIPRILADFHLDASFTAGEPTGSPNVEFKNVRLDLGSFVTKFLKPLVDKVNEIISPFDPVLNALQTRIPVLSDIMGRDYTVLDLAVQFGKVDRRFVDAVLQIRELVADIAALPSGVNITIPLGEMLGLGSALSTKNGAKNVDTSSAGNTAVGFGAVEPGSNEERYRNTFNKSTTITGGGFGFPILKPANAFKLLLGQEATLVTYDIPRLEVGMSMTKTFPIWGPLVGKFSGSISAYADFAVGFDTKGFNTYRTSGDVTDILDGFFVSDRANADGTGADVPEAGFKGRIGIGGAINAAIIEAGIEGFFELFADLDLKDPNNDGKIRGSEIKALITHPNGYSLLNLGSIRLRGEVGARAYVDFWAPFDWYNAWEWEFARVKLFDKTFSAPDVTPTLGNVATVAGASTLTLNAGDSANKRQFISTSDVGEEFIVSGSGKNITVTFTNTGHTQSFTNLDRIVFNGGKGNDRLIVGAGITTAITFNGGEGDDYFEGSDGDDIVIGGAGNDTIFGGKGNNTLDGGAGADVITGGNGNDIIIGGLGDDVLNGGGGNDTYRFSDEWGNDVFDGDQTGTGAFDFSNVTKDLTLNVSAGGAQGSSGNNFIAFQSNTPYINSIKGGSGNDVTTIAATGSLAMTVDGGQGSDQYLVSFGRLNTAIQISDTGTGLNDSDTVSVIPLSRDYTIDVRDNSVSGTKVGLTTTQTVNFTNAVENLTVDAKSNGGSVVQIAEAISFKGNVKILARQSIIENTIDAGNLRIESTTAVNIAANVNAHDNGNVTVLVNGGNITVTEDVMSSAGSGFTGDGAGLVHLFTSGGAILTGQGNGGPGRILAEDGALLLRGTNGSIGSISTPIYSTVSLLAASTTGSGLINLHESNGLTVGTIASIEGIKTEGGILNIFNDANVLRIVSPITLNGGDGTLTSDEIQIEANVSSPNGDIFLRPEGDTTIIAVGEGVTGVFDLKQSEINHLVNGFASIQIGLPLGRNLINLGNANFVDVTLLQNPILGGHVNQTGIVTVGDGASFTIFGSGHTTELNNQTVAGNIDIIDSAIVRQGETVTLTSTGGSVNINFDLDGTAGGADETLIINAAGDVVIKGAIGSTAQLGTLRIAGATNIRFEGSMNVKNLVLDAGTTFTIDGSVNAQKIDLNGVSTATFRSGVTLATDLSSSGSTLISAVFEGQVIAQSINLVALQLVDFYQLVDVTNTLSVRTTSATGDIIFRQQVDANTGDITLRAQDDITFIGPVIADDLTIIGVDVLSFQASVQLSGALLQSAGTGVSSFAQLSADSMNITSAGLTLGGITTLSEAQGLTVNVGNGTFNALAAVSAPQGPLDVRARTITFQNTVAAASANLIADENVTVANASSFTLTGALTATTSNPGLGEIKFTGPVSVGAGATLSTPRTLTFTNTLGVTGALLVQAASSAQYQGAVNVTGTFTQQAGVTGATAFGITLTAGSLNLQASSLIFGGDVTSNGSAVVTANVGGITAAANVSVNGSFNANSAANIALQAATAAHSINLTAPGTITIGVGGLSTSASPTTGNVQIITTGAVAGNSVTMNGVVDVKGSLGIATSRGVLATNTVNADSLNASGTALTFNSLVTTVAAAAFTTSGSLNLASGLTAGGILSVTAGSATFGEAVTAAAANISAVSTINISVGGLTSTSGTINLNTSATGAGNSITALGQVDAATLLSINTPRGVALNLVEAESMDVTAASINLPSAVTTSGPITLNAAVTGNITAGSTINAGGLFTITQARAVSFSGLVSANAVAIAQGGTDSVETVSVGVGGITTMSDLRIRTTVVGAGNGITTQGTLTAGSSATIALQSVRGVEANGAIYGGTLSVSGANITLRGVSNLAEDAIFASTGTVSIQSDLTAGDDVVVSQAGALSFAARLTANDLFVSNAGNATFTGQVSLGSTATLSLTGDLATSAAFSASDLIEVVSVRDASFGGLVSADVVRIGKTNARTLTVSAAGVSAVDSLMIQSTAAGGTLNINGPTSATSGPLVLISQGAITTTAAISGDTVAVTSPSVTIGGPLAADGAGTSGIITLNSTVQGAGSLLVSGLVSSSGSLLVGNSASPRSVALNGALTVGNDLIITATETLSTGAQVTVARDVALSTTDEMLGEVRINGALSSGRDLVLNTPRNATFLAPVTVGRDATITNAAALQFDGALNVTGLLTQVAGSASSRFAAISAASVDINSRTIAVTNTVTATSGDATFQAALDGKVTVGGNTNLAGALSIPRADEVILSGNVTAASVNVGSTSVRSMTFGTNLSATGGGITLAGNAGPINVVGTLLTPAALNIPSGTTITLGNKVTAASAAIAGNALVASNDITTTSGGLFISTTGDVSVAGKTTVAQSLLISGSEDVTLSGAVIARDFSLIGSSFLAGGAFSTSTGDANFTTSGNIRIVGLALIAEDLTITSALNTTFQGQVAVIGMLTQQNGGGATRFEGVTAANTIQVRTAQQIFAGSILRVNGGDMRLEADEIDFFGGTNSVQGSARITLRPYFANTSIDVGSPTPTGILDLSDVDINALQDGFAQITIGRTEDATGAMLIGSSSFRDSVAFHAGSIIVENNPLVGQVFITQDSLEMTARTGSITTNDDLFATDAHFRASEDITINQRLEVADFVIFEAGTDSTGSIAMNGTLLTTAAGGTVDFSVGTTAGNIVIPGFITTTNAELEATAGFINQITGRTTANQLRALAETGVQLITTSDHISARVTGIGNLTITDNNSAPAHILTLGSSTDVNDGIFTADGDITVSTNRNLNALRVSANGAVNLSAGGELNFKEVVGAPATMQGTTIYLDKSPVTNGENIVFDGNLVLMRDISFTSNGGDVSITGRINNGTGGPYNLTFNTQGGNVSVGGAIGNLTPLTFLQVNNAGTFALGGGARIIGNIEINADAIAITAPRGSIITTAGSQLRLLPNSTSAPIDLGAPAGGTAKFSLNDAELEALGNGFSLIQIGLPGSTHDVTIESARFLDDLEINANSVTLKASSVVQSVNGLSVVNGQDDNDIRINAIEAFTQERRAALVAGRNGNIAITADQITLDSRNLALIRGFGELLLQPYTTTQAITLGGAGAPGGFDLTTGEYNALGSTFSKVTIGRADGAHPVTISGNLNLRDNTLIRTPELGGSVTIGSSASPVLIQAVGRTDNLRIESAGDLIVDGSIRTAGRGKLELLADHDGDGAGDLRIGQNLSATNKVIQITSELGAIILRGNSVAIGSESTTLKDVGIVNVTTLGGDINIRTDSDADGIGDFTFRHVKSTLNTLGVASVIGGAAGGVADLGAGTVTGKRGVNFSGFESFITTATKIKSDLLVAIEAVNATLMTKTAITTLADIQVLGAATGGTITLEKGAVLRATKSITLNADTVMRDPLAVLSAKAITIIQ